MTREGRREEESEKRTLADGLKDSFFCILVIRYAISSALHYYVYLKIGD